MAEQKLAAMPPAESVSARQVLRVYRPGDRVETPSGTRSVAGLRPGDRARIGSGVLSVLWMAMSRSGPDKRATIRVMLGEEASRREAPKGLPLAGRISSRTGKLEMERGFAPQDGAAAQLH